MTLPPYMTPRAVTPKVPMLKETLCTESVGRKSPRSLLKRCRESSLRQVGDPAEVRVVLCNELLKKHTVSEEQLLMMSEIQDALHRGFQQIAASSSPQRRPKKRAFIEEASSSKSSLTSRLMSAQQLDPAMPRVESVPAFSKLHSKPQAGNMMKSTSSPGLAKLASNMVVIQGPASASVQTKPSTRSPYNDTNPEDLLKSIIKSKGFSTDPVPAVSIKDFFLETTPKHVAGYSSDVIQAVRQENIHELREMLRSGKTLQCCNRFGESIVHMACRRGSEKVLKFLMEEAKVSIRLADDYGRNPVHDACWTREPEFALMVMLIKESPDLLLVSDKRGHTPLSYARRDHWGAWCEFLMEQSHLLCPKELGR